MWNVYCVFNPYPLLRKNQSRQSIDNQNSFWIFDFNKSFFNFYLLKNYMKLLTLNMIGHLLFSAHFMISFFTSSSFPVPCIHCNEKAIKLETTSLRNDMLKFVQTPTVIFGWPNIDHREKRFALFLESWNI